MEDECSLHQRKFIVGCTKCCKSFCSDCLQESINELKNKDKHLLIEYQEFKNEILKNQFLVSNEKVG